MIANWVIGTVGVIAAPVICGLAYRKVRQPRIARQLLIATPNQMVEERFVRIGGIDQWIQIRGEDRRNPVLLILHGGPDWPNAVFTPLLRSWEKHFIVIQWDHRGAGKTRGWGNYLNTMAPLPQADWQEGMVARDEFALAVFADTPLGIAADVVQLYTPFFQMAFLHP